MSFLVDTHVLLWWFDDPAKLSDEARSVIANGKNTVFVSAVNAWEIAIKKALGKLEAPDNLEEVIADSRFSSLPITIAHALAVAQLPFHHNDPFDRLLVAQTTVERLTLITRDDVLKMYGIPFIEA